MFNYWSIKIIIFKIYLYIIILMNNITILQNIFIICLFIVLLISFYFFIDTLVFKNKDSSKIFSAWQFPMLLAIYVDTVYGL